MSTDFAVFKKFSNLEQAQELAATLKQNGIENKLVNNSPQMDITFSGNTLQNEAQLLLLQSDFAKANEVLRTEAEKVIEQMDKDYYLFDFTNEELYEIIMKPDEWGAFDYTLAQKLLKDRGLTVDEELINTLRKQRVSDLAKPEEGQQPMVLVGYLLALLGGLLGLLVGWFLWTYTKTLPDGQKVHAYSESDQKHGRNIFFLGLVFLVFWVTFRLILEY
jgi:hypothetical protein